MGAAIAASLALATPAGAVTTPVPYAGGTYTQNFDSLTSTTTTVAISLGAKTSPANIPDTVAGDSLVLPGWQGVNTSSGSGTTTLFGVDTGSLTQGAIYSYGVAGVQPVTDRALGTLASGTTVSEYGVILQNTTGGSLNEITVNYEGETWRVGALADPNTLAFAYSTTASDITGSFTGVSALNYTTGTTGNQNVANTAIDGHATGNNQMLSATVFLPTAWAPGTNLILRWADTNDPSNDWGIAVDNLSFSAASVVVPSVTWAAGTGAWDTASPNWTGASTMFANGDQTVFGDGTTGTVTIVAGGVQPVSTSVTNTTGTYTFTGADSVGLAGGGTLTKTGGGTLVLASQNSFTGGTQVNGGILNISNDNALGVGGGLTLNGGTLQFGGGATLLRAISIGSSGGTIDTNGNTVTIGNTGGSGATLSGSGNFTKIGAGTLITNTVPAYSGTTSILGGLTSIFSMSLGTAVPTISAPPAGSNAFTGTLLMASDFNLNLVAGDIGGGGLVRVPFSTSTISNGSATNSSSSISNNIVLNENGLNQPFYVTIGSTVGNTLTINGVISGPSDVDFAAVFADGGAGTLVLNAVNTYGYPSNADATVTTSHSTIKSSNAAAVANNSGITRLGIDNALPTTTSLVFGYETTGTTPAPAKVGSFDLNGHTQTVESLSSFTDGTTYSVANGITNTSTNVAPGTLIINATAAQTAALGISSSVYAGPIGAVAAADLATSNNNEALTLASTNVSTLTLGGASTYTGGTTINGGELICASPTGSGVGTGPVVNNVAGGFAVQLSSTGPSLGTTAGATPSSVSGTGSTLVDVSSTLTTGFIRQSGGLTINGNVAITPQTGPRNNAASLTVVGGLTIGASTGLLDLSNNDMVVQGVGASGLTTITAQIKQGANSGAWNGTQGITSSTAATAPGTGLGVELNDDGTPAHNTLFSTFDGQTVTNTDVLVKYTYLGDANLDGVVNASDYTLIDNGYNSQATATPLTGWRNGDFNYSGSINGDDYLLIDNSFNNQTTPLVGVGATPASMIASNTEQASSAVPEPTSLCVIGLGAAGLLGRRRRRNS